MTAEPDDLIAAVEQLLQAVLDHDEPAIAHRTAMLASAAADGTEDIAAAIIHALAAVAAAGVAAVAHSHALRGVEPTDPKRLLANIVERWRADAL